MLPDSVVLAVTTTVQHRKFDVQSFNSGCDPRENLNDRKNTDTRHKTKAAAFVLPRSRRLV